MSQIACKWMTNMRSEAFFIYSRGAYTIFCLAKPKIQPLQSDAGSKRGTYFRPARQKNYYIVASFLYLLSIRLTYQM